MNIFALHVGNLSYALLFCGIKLCPQSRVKTLGTVPHLPGVDKLLIACKPQCSHLLCNENRSIYILGSLVDKRRKSFKNSKHGDPQVKSTQDMFVCCCCL